MLMLVFQVDLTNGPVKDLVFTQFQATITGQVECAESCPTSQLAVRLLSIDDNESTLTANVEVDKVSCHANLERSYLVELAATAFLMIILSVSKLPPCLFFCQSTSARSTFDLSTLNDFRTFFAL